MSDFWLGFLCGGGVAALLTGTIAFVLFLWFVSNINVWPR